MNFKLIGAIFIISGFGCAGFVAVLTHKKTVRLMQRLISIFEYMECELAYRMTPLPELFRKIPGESDVVKRYFNVLANELEGQVSPDVACCAIAALTQVQDLPDLVQKCILVFSQNTGCFDIDGQLKGIASARENCVSSLGIYTKNQDIRLRNYQALALCAGATVVILLL